MFISLDQLLKSLRNFLIGIEEVRFAPPILLLVNQKVVKRSCGINIVNDTLIHVNPLPWNTIQ